jgi:hypothetical protein
VRPLGADFWRKYSEIVSSQEKTYKGFFKKTLAKKGTRPCFALGQGRPIFSDNHFRGFVVDQLNEARLIPSPARIRGKKYSIRFVSPETSRDIVTGLFASLIIESSSCIPR